MRTIMKTLISIGLVLLVILFGLQVAPKAWIAQPMLMDGGKSGGGGGGGGGGTTACDFGPNATFPTGTVVGADLTTAGFTHCALNADFTDTSGATTGGGFVMNNPNTWLNGCPGPSETQVWGKFWLDFAGLNVMNVDNGPTACNRAVMTTDAGSQVLEYSFTNGDLTSSTKSIGLYWPLCGSRCASFGLGNALPNGHYIEWTYKITGNGQSESVLHNMEENVYDTDCSAACDDYDYQEATANGVQWVTSMDAYGCTGVGSKCSNGFFWGTGARDDVNYHVYGFLTSGDGNTNQAVCVYVDGANPSKTAITGWTDGNTCGPWAMQTSAFLHNSYRAYLMLCNCDSIGSFNTTTIVLKSVRVWTCAGYRTGQCTGTVVNHS